MLVFIHHLHLVSKITLFYLMKCLVEQMLLIKLIFLMLGVATNQKAVPAYSITPLDKYDLWTASADYPFNASAGPREDPIYRTTEPYPLQYYSDVTYGNYLKFSQYFRM
jgi:hypothetical protein